MARLLGIDIGTTGARVALVRTSYRRVALEALYEVSFEHAEAGISALAGAGMREHAAFSPIRKLRADGAAVALPGDECFYRRLELPGTAQKELESVLGFELEASIPFELDAAVFDHRVLRRAGPDEPVVVFAAVAQVRDVKARIERVKEALGREPELVSPGAVSLAELVAVVPELAKGIVRDEAGGEVPSLNAPVALLDLGETRTELVMLVAGEPAFARTLSRGTQGLPASARALGQELRQTFAAFRAQGGDPPSILYLAGAGADVHGAETFLAGVLAIPVKVLTKFAVELVPPAKQPGPGVPPGVTADRAGELPRYAKAIALALALDGRGKTLDLRRGSLEAARSYAYLRERLPLLSGLAAVIAVSFGFSVVAELRALSAERAALDERLRATTLEVFGEETIDVAKASELLEKGPAGEEDPLPGVDAFDLMAKYSQAVPEDVVHDVAEFDVARGHAVIQGIVPMDTDAQATADKIATALRAEPCFRDVKVQKTVQFGQDKQKYVLELDLRCEDKVKKKKAGAAGAAGTTEADAKPKAEEDGGGE